MVSTGSLLCDKEIFWVIAITIVLLTEVLYVRCLLYHSIEEACMDNWPDFSSMVRVISFNLLVSLDICGVDEFVSAPIRQVFGTSLLSRDAGMFLS